jgi:hypothetical protein
METNRILPRNTRDRRLYTWAAFLIPLVVLIGFARSYYLKGLFGAPALPSLLVHLHGLVMTAWVVLFGAQVWLVASRRTRVHQRLGIAGSILAGLVVIVGTMTAINAASRGSAPPGVTPLQFLVVPFFDMLVFAILIGIALFYRRRFELHKRLMLLAALSLLNAAVARIPLHFIETGGPLAFFAVTDFFIIACVVFDTIKHRRLHPAFLWGTLFIIVSQPLRLMLAGTDVWMGFASWMVS